LRSAAARAEQIFSDLKFLTSSWRVRNLEVLLWCRKLCEPSGWYYSAIHSDFLLNLGDYFWENIRL